MTNLDSVGPYDPPGRCAPRGLAEMFLGPYAASIAAEAANAFGRPRTNVCQMCDDPFSTCSERAKFCIPCRQKRDRLTSRERKRVKAMKLREAGQ